MTKVIKLSVISLGLLALTGCANFAKVIEAAGKSTAAVHFTIVSPQGTLTYDRANPNGTNDITVGGTSGITTK
jgi:heptaprenylglyceryl phosphate synthase